MLGLVNQVIQRLSSQSESSEAFITSRATQPYNQTEERWEEEPQYESQLGVRSCLDASVARATKSRTCPDFSQIEITNNNINNHNSNNNNDNNNNNTVPSFFSQCSPEDEDFQSVHFATSALLVSPVMAERAETDADCNIQDKKLSKHPVSSYDLSSSLYASHTLPLVILPHTPPSSLTLTDQAPTVKALGSKR